MIEVTTKTIEGVSFIADMKVLEADQKYMGVSVHIIPDMGDAELFMAIKAMGLRRVGPTLAYLNRSYYALGRFSYWRVMLTRLLFRGYWAVVKWLYDNGRVFKQIPAGDRFSWSYFTPYCWYLKAKAKF